VSRPLSAPRDLTATWIALLLSPVAWALALGILYSLTDEVCASGTRGTMVAVAGLCIMLALAPAPLAWTWRRRIDGRSASEQRARFLLAAATGASLIFTLVTIVTAVPIAMLDACRT
jgi:hypothetical protein